MTVNPTQPTDVKLDRTLGDQGAYLLTRGDYLGTLAVLQACGRRQQPAVLADSTANNLCHASRYRGATVTVPDSESPDTYAARLLEIGSICPGLVLYPSSDDVTWTIARYRDELSAYFRLYTPKIEVIHSLLNKPELYALAQKWGMDTPQTFAPTSLEALGQFSSTLSYPVLIKPRMQVALLQRKKGQVCNTPAELLALYPDFQRRFQYHPALLAYDPEVVWPMVQAFHTSASTETYSIEGFYDQSGEVFLTRAATKVLQFPLKVGVGLCFESRPVLAELAKPLQLMMQDVGYYGAFEAEFIPDQTGGWMLMDFNPRFYGQMNFELFRGLPLDRLVWAGAMNDQALIHEIAKIDAVQQQSGDFNNQPYRFANCWKLKLIVTTQAIAGRMSWKERGYWLRWINYSANFFVDQVYAKDDPGPSKREIHAFLRGILHHPRSSLRTLFGNL
jgi:predicted ATP-grasp superfamily ATP-dependent carboligase